MDTRPSTKGNRLANGGTSTKFNPLTPPSNRTLDPSVIDQEKPRPHRRSPPAAYVNRSTRQTPEERRTSRSKFFWAPEREVRHGRE
jgi:hypothetical protein